MNTAVIIPVHGQHQFTNQTLSDLRGQADLFVVDNKGDFRHKEVRILRPGKNLGWLDGTNLGLQEAVRHNYDLYVCLNNDVRLSTEFIRNLIPMLDFPGCGVFAPTYQGSHTFLHPSSQYAGRASEYIPANIVREVPFVDGTCLCIPQNTLQTVGLLDPHFNPIGWGAEQDYAIRVREHGLRAYVTEKTYLYHFGQKTADSLIPNYNTIAETNYSCKMVEKYGEGYWNKVWGLTT